MINLRRALWMTLKYKWSLIGSFVCCLLVAILWGANLGAVYPFVEIVMQKKTLVEWVDERSRESDTRIAEKQQQIADLESQIAAEKAAAAPDSVASLKTKITLANAELDGEVTRKWWTETLAPWIRSYAPKSAFATLGWLMGFMFLGTVMRGLFLMGNMVLVARVGQRTVLDMQNDVFRNVLDMEVSELGVRGTGDLVSRIRGETGAIGQAISILFGKTIREPMKMAVCLGGAAWFNWRLLLFSMLICPLAGYLMMRLARMTKRANKKAVEESANLLNRLYQALTYLRVVKAFTNEPNERTRFKTVARDVYKKGMRIAFYNSLSRINSELLGVGMITLSVLAGGYLVINETCFLGPIRLSSTVMDYGTLLTFFGFLIGVADPLRKMADVYNTIQGGVVAADRVFPLIDQTPAVASPASPTAVPTGELDIEIRDVRFSYDESNEVLKGVNVSIPAGTSLAIIGPNGCGKSTMINLIPRFFDVGGGKIEIGGHDIRDFDVRSLRQKIGYVTQMTMLFNDTIAENIAYGNESATIEQVRDAAIQAHADGFIEALDNGYDSQIGEHGGKLSGGQRQRLSLARAILKDPEILILDEATSQIDPESEQLIHETLAEFIKGRTTVMITHRLSTLDLVDRILLMDGGEVVDCGTHNELLARCPVYQRMQNFGLDEVA
ncbi:ABC transporter ATP-binding protein [Mariniblastus fucicola]|uniref:Lipid A export ATP-binding/permease protein MsbA n=1 Tax=Mariniblastus fucicola TaxID=980251 RepID=A0A5B9PE82_9BACT|nr:ABC transporter ATP-binding protein [Mariniblastus fucicola]QEG23505.1 Lipid A export ATP-binding/permease protein MsbA [Mariniblastus fucicola]